jgi:hypothetical protein
MKGVRFFWPQRGQTDKIPSASIEDITAMIGSF